MFNADAIWVACVAQMYPRRSSASVGQSASVDRNVKGQSTTRPAQRGVAPADAVRSASANQANAGIAAR